METLIAAAGGSFLAAVILYVALRLFDEPLKALVGIAASREIELFKGQLSEQLELLRAQLQQDREAESFQRARRIDFLERQLSQFFWPLHLRLQRDDAVWRRILEKDGVARSIDEYVLLPNHKDTVAIIEKGLHLARLDGELEECLLKYVRHVAVYMALRQSGNYSTHPYDLGEPYPAGFSKIIKRRTEQLQTEYDRLIELETAPTSVAP